MHMADALISPVVGGSMWMATAGIVSYAAKKVQAEIDERKTPLMGVMGAFVFAAQMINFAIPGTGSSGHLGGGLLLAVLLGPYAAFLTMASILTVQALFFADGGLLALGCNIFNLGFFPCFIAYPLFYRPLAGSNSSQIRLFLGAVLAAVIGLQLGAFGVVVETFFSGVSALPFTAFVLLTQPIHLAIGIVEGLITATVIWFICREAPDILTTAGLHKPLCGRVKRVLLGLLIATVFLAGALSWLASTHPDGLEWSIMKVTGEEELQAPHGIHDIFARGQEKIAFLPGYNFKQSAPADIPQEPAAATWPAVDTGTSVAGIIGSLLTLLLAYCIGKVLRSLTRQHG